MKVSFCCVALLFAIFAVPVIADGDDASAILAHHRAFVGWQADDNTVASTKVTYAIRPLATSAPADDSSVLVESRKGLVYRDNTSTGKELSVGFGFNGKQFWHSDESGNSAIVLEEDARVAYTENIIDAEAVAFVPAAVHGTAQVRSRIADVVRISPPMGATADLYVDRATGEYLREVIDPDDRFYKDTIEILGYRDLAPGKKLIAETRDSSAGEITRVTSAELNPAIEPSELGMPKSKSEWTFASTAPYPILVASEATGAGRSVRIRASINGHEGTFLLDSGASGTIIYSPYADTIGLEALGKSSFTGVNGNSLGAKLARVKDLAIGPNVLHDVVVNVVNQRGGGIDGILGFQVLANAIVDVDLAEKAITILDPAKFEATVGKGAFAFPIDLTTFQPGIILTLPKGVIAHPIFDTGNDGNVLLAQDLYNSGKVTGLTDATMYFTGVDGNATSPSNCIRVDMGAGPYRYTRAQTCFATTDTFGKDGGLIGFDFLRHFNWTFDYPERKVVLTPNGL